MSYIINQPNGQLILQLPDGTADGPNVNPGLNATDINLIGHNYPSYGLLQNENFIDLLQNFANNTPPLKPLPGELWYDTGTGFLKVYSGSKWIAVSPLFVSNTAPATTTVGVEWWDTVNQQFKVFNGSTFTTVGPAYSVLDGISGAVVEDILDTNNNSHTVVMMYINGTIVSIVSNDATFTPLVPITGFTTISQGLTLSTTNGGQVFGTSTNSQQLGNIAAVNYARTDITTTFSANLAIGSGAFTLKYHPDGHVGISNSILDGNIAIYNNVGGINTKTLEIQGTTGLITVAGKPTVPLGVATKGYVDTSIATAISPLAPSQSPNFSGNATSVTPATLDNSTKIATTAFTQAAISASTTSLWEGSAQFVSTTTPDPTQGKPGDFWFQI